MTAPFVFFFATKTSPIMKGKDDSLVGESDRLKSVDIGSSPIIQFLFSFSKRSVFIMATVDKQRRTESYDVDQVIELVRQLSRSQGFYGRLLERILYLKEYEPELFEEFKMVIEDQHFKDPVDDVLFFEQ